MVAFFFAALFGNSMKEPAFAHILEGGTVAAQLAIFAVFLMHAGERYNRHVADRTPFIRIPTGDR
jgi:hypothetical protein